jgi:2-amino-4-hydroxy-6-hydroxymethyldihydropteridine diphosphokinase
MMATAYIGFGSNLGDSPALLDQSIAAIEATPGVTLLRISPSYRSEPLGVEQVQPDYLNTVFEVRVSLTAAALLERLLDIENRLGRVRDGQRNAARTVDLDLLLYDEQTCRTDDLVLPHPRMHERAFVLQPLHDLVPNLVIPGYGTVASLLSRLPDQSVQRLQGEQMVARR